MSYSKLSPNIKKRILKEINKYNLNAELINDDTELIILLDFKNKQIKNYNIFLILSLTNYPFVVPEISYIINNKKNSVSKIYRTCEILSDKMKEITDRECLLCSSYLCRYNWAPTNKIIDIVNEFLFIIDSKFRVVEKIYCDKIQDQLIDRLPLNDFRISNYL